MEIVLEKRQITVILLIILGFLFFTDGVRDRYNVKTVTPIENITAENIRKGKYVSGPITQYAGFVPESLASGEFRGVSITFLNAAFREIDFYTVRLSDGHYITVMVENRGTKYALETYEKGIGNSAYIEGVITTPLTFLNYEWLETALGKNGREEVEELVLPQYAIKQIDFAEEGKGVYYGFGCILTAAIIFLYERHERKRLKE